MKTKRHHVFLCWPINTIFLLLIIKGGNKVSYCVLSVLGFCLYLVLLFLIQLLEIATKREYRVLYQINV